eukprot:m.176266 g.176266  ORF g.176266 m.176266 type:complete len:269 (+) comp39138_c0_seq34:265-1071(+)
MIILFFARFLPCIAQNLELKNFKEEVRGPVDVFHFLSQSVPVLLDLHGKSLNEIVDRMLEAMSHEDEESVAKKMREEAKQGLFTADSVHQLASTIQGTEISEGGGTEPDQLWVTAISELANIQRRHVAIARLASPVNLGPTMQDVRFIILVLAPMKEKGTKNALETGRTFATLFSDAELRNLLLSASNVEEFKRLLLDHTRQLMDSVTGFPSRTSGENKKPKVSRHHNKLGNRGGLENSLLKEGVRVRLTILYSCKIVLHVYVRKVKV